MVYFIRNRADGLIKIGATKRLSDRLKTLASEFGGDLEIMAVVDGSFQEERGLHRRFAALRRFGEWFEPGDDLIGFIVAEGREWREEDDTEKDKTAIRIDRGIVEKARFVAFVRGTTISEILNSILRVRLPKLHAKAMKEYNKKYGGNR